MAQRLLELCSVLIENAYGDLAAQIFATLAAHGRMSLLALRQFSGIPPSRLKIGLTTLIQHHIILYYALEEYEPTEFQIDWHATYALVRSRKFIDFVIDTEGEAAGQVISNILQLGHVSVGDLEDEYDLDPGSKRDSGIDTVEEYMNEHGLFNGITKEGSSRSTQNKITAVYQLHDTLRNLLAKGVLIKVHGRTYTPSADLDKQVRETVIAEEFPDGKVAGPKKEKAFQLAFNRLKRKWRDEDDYSKSRDTASHGSIKHCTPSTSNHKRIKITKTANGVDQQKQATSEETSSRGDLRSDRLPNDMVVHVDFAKFTMLLRNQRIEQMVHNFLGPSTSAVFGALVRALTARSKSIRDSIKSDDAEDEDDDEKDEDTAGFATDAEVLEYLDDTIDLDSRYQAVKDPKLPNGIYNPRKKQRVAPDDVEDAAQVDVKIETHSDSEQEPEVDSTTQFEKRNKRLQSVARHLNILAEHPKRFCIRLPETTRTKVDLSHVVGILIQHELETMINARFGKVPTRLIRILKHSGKMEVQQLADMTMTHHNDVCTALTSLQFAHLAHCQEVPRTNNLDTSRALHLWWFDEKNVVSQYLDMAYQAMARTLQRVRFERENTFRAAIEKAERVDVRGREHEMLNSQDKEALRKWSEVEEQLLVQVDRLDDLVAVLRDFNGKDTSLST